MKDVIVIPTYNERENIRKLIPAIFRELPEVHIVVVDDNSPDKTGDEVENLQHQYANLTLLRRNKKDGLGAAYKYALTKLRDDSSIRNIITMDADGSHSPLYLKKFISELEKHDLVIGSRYIPHGGIENWSKRRQLLSRWGNIYARTLTGLRIRDVTSGFVGFRASKLKTLPFETIRSSGYAYQIHFKYLFAKSGGTFAEIPIIFKEREHGQSKITFSIILEGILTPLQLLLDRVGSN
jgi:dolichol-phosphate mannosyltransferase